MIHPLVNDLQSVPFEELEKRKNEVLSRMQKLRSWGQSGNHMWEQLQSLLNSLDLEMEERVKVQDNNKNPAKHVVVNTDPLDEEIEELAKQKRGPKQYTIL